ncbi:uncharacterized protein ASCRUDRAFT_11533 [Ascoidea rubescens DSM 1968]|uniref:Uncharacterized protein n=1 Tax=Ascoidea rubescens DSM 1968 TaxID=1344418 RepID=A0A1D2VRE4_9ASCO|nr:hypothetical protein ASCRUDRAFT_11533 [Ascoidea rubescens DSM 1968]ODV64182.1 hypothetical protein ASCRUDRAFT_11533 [Ascoidea rubescens DSM 1968]
MIKIQPISKLNPSLLNNFCPCKTHFNLFSSLSISLSKSNDNKRRLKNVPSFEEFLVNKEIKDLYKKIIRIIYKKIPTNLKNGLIEYTKSEFRVPIGGNINDKSEILYNRKYALTIGKREFKKISSQFGINLDNYKN